MPSGLRVPSGAIQMLATPFSYIYSAAALEKDPNFPDKNILGTGPYKFGEYVPGSHWVGKRNEEYWDKGKPYLDGFRALFRSGSRKLRDSPHAAPCSNTPWSGPEQTPMR